MPTLGAGFKTKEVYFTDEGGNQGRMKLNLWDTAGQEKFDALTKMYFKGAEAALIVYDVTNAMSFEKAQKWVKDLDDTEASEQQQVLKFLVGNKCDCVDQIEVSVQQGSEYAKQINSDFNEVSAKENTGISELFAEIASQLHERDRKNIAPGVIPHVPNRGMSVLDKPKKKRKGCC